MPRRRSQSERRALLLAVGSVVFALLLLLGLSVLSGRGDVELANLGDRDYEVGSAANFAELIAEDHRPILVPDASPNQDRPIYVDHAGGPVDEGWIAVLAYDDGCALEYTGEDYIDCNGERHARDGAELTRYRAYVRDGAVFVDLRDVVE